MTIGAYTIFLASTLVEQHAPGAMAYYFPVAIGVAFVFAFIAGWLVEWGLIRHLYKRPLDTLLATWGVSLGLQQAFRSEAMAKPLHAGRAAEAGLLAAQVAAHRLGAAGGPHRGL